MVRKIAAVLVLALACLGGAGAALATPFPAVSAQQRRAALALGSSACVANAEITATRHALHARQPLDATARYYLRPWFGDLVDQVEVIWNATFNDQVALARYVFPQGSRAQTYGYQLYVAASQGGRDPESPQQLILLAHELVHTAQYVRYGQTLVRFCQEYVQGWIQSGGVYKQNPLEQEAFDTAFAFAHWLGQQVSAASRADSLVYLHEGDRQPAPQTRIPRRLLRVDASRQMPLQRGRSRP